MEKAKRQIHKPNSSLEAIKFLSQSLSKFPEIYIPAFFRSILNVESFFYILAWGFSYAGIFYHNFFYGFMLIEVIVRVSVLKNVIMAIYQPRVQILVTLFLFLMFIYYFTLIAVYYFADQFPNDNDTANLFQTFMRMVDQTFKQDGGVGAYLDKTKSKTYDAASSSSFQGARFFYDYVFNLLILILVFQMFLSIIKDYFSRQREEQKKFEETVQRICLICGIEREKLEKIYSNHKNAFDIHINYDHNIYDYICYLNYLQNKTKRDKIIENSVWELHLNNNYFFLPKDV
jgi:inositol 1,4,5-triphosphate receptor type 1